MAWHGVWLTAMMAMALTQALPPAPIRAATILESSLAANGGRVDLAADYGVVNSRMLQSLADAIDLIESEPSPATDEAADLRQTWRRENQAFVRELSGESGRLTRLQGEPLRLRLAEYRLYERIVAALKRNLVTVRALITLERSPGPADRR